MPTSTSVGVTPVMLMIVPVEGVARSNEIRLKPEMHRRACSAWNFSLWAKFSEIFPFKSMAAHTGATAYLSLKAFAPDRWSGPEWFRFK